MNLLTLCFVSCFSVHIIMHYSDVNDCTKDIDDFHSLSVCDKGLFGLCVKILIIIAKKKSIS